MAACAAFSKESRMGFANAAKLRRKSGGAQARYLQYPRATTRQVLQILERETGIEPATNGLGSRYSTIELLPLAATRLFYP